MAKARMDSESIGQGLRITRCDGCGESVTNDYPYYKKQWRDAKGLTTCDSPAAMHRPASAWDKRRPRK